MKKTMTLIVSLALAVAIGIGGTLAWLTSTSETVTNTFTVGGLKIILDEVDIDSSTEALSVTGKDRDTANGYKITPSAVLNKDPMVTMIGNNEESYVFMEVTVPKEISSIAEIDFPSAGTTWTLMGSPATDSITGAVTSVYYQAVDAIEGVAPDHGTELKPLFNTVTIDSAADNDAITAADGKTIVVTAYAIQKNAGATPELAWAAGGWNV